MINMMNIDKLPVEYRPISPIKYFGYMLLFSIPLIGLIPNVIFALSNININRRNFARTFLMIDAVLFIILVIFGLLGGYAYIATVINK
jgi:hypothetical protein